MDIQIAVNAAALSQLNYKRNREAREAYHVLYPLLKPHHPSSPSTYSDAVGILHPDIFPKSVAKFVEMTGSDVKYLLEFYGLDDLGDSVSTPLDTGSSGSFLFEVAPDKETNVGRYRCLQIIANHIGLKLDLVKYPGLDIFRDYDLC
ncbi:hypothetical protein TWF102_009716 [Orbilia oligospora]|uniref:Uncharacterized protein n=1 Tax=Orbilia oligospora TaxID=2813651 RepID=A0A7C8N3M8_ORBOL|nr:hypothetical protein TWF102_009716 [Orbilia oligospora]